MLREFPIFKQPINGLYILYLLGSLEYECKYKKFSI